MHHNLDNIEGGKFIARKRPATNLLDISLLPPGMVCFSESRSGKSTTAAAIFFHVLRTSQHPDLDSFLDDLCD